MRIIPDPVNPQGEISIEQVHSPQDLEKEAALQLVVQDTQTTESYLQTNYWSLRWREADALYQAVGLDTPVRTEFGFKPILDVHLGDRVFGKDGKLRRVIGESKIFYNRPCYEIEFETGEKVIADSCHLWETTACHQTTGLGPGNNPNSWKSSDPKNNWKKGSYTAIRNTEEIFRTLFYGKKQRHNHKILTVLPLECTKKDFLVDPYTLGVWLGDGDSDAPRITSADPEIISHLEKIEDIPSKKQQSLSKASRYAFTNYPSKDASLQTRLRYIEVLDNKHIPKEYFNGSKEQRLALLQGLLDTDGSCSTAGSVSFRNTNYNLVIGVKNLIASLGWKASIKNYYCDRYTDGVIHSVHFTPDGDDHVFRLSRKAVRQYHNPVKNTRKHRTIKNIISVPSVPVKCLSVEGEFYLITDGLIVTHNSPPGIIMWEGTSVPRANVNRFVVAETVNSIHPQIMNGLFYEDPPFVLRPQPNEDQNTTRAISSLLSIQLDEMELRQEVDWGLSSALLFGTAIWKWGFNSYPKEITKYVKAEENITVPSSLPGQPPTEIETPDSITYRKETVEEIVHVPTFENKDIRYILVDASCHVPDIRKAKFVIDRMYLTYKDLAKLADEEYMDVNEEGKQVLKKRYDLPSKDEIKEWFAPPKEMPASPGQSEALAVQGTTFVHHAKPVFQKSTADPLDEPLEVLERWDGDKVITVLNRIKCIRNEPNEFKCIPFFSLNWWNTPDAFWGLGLGRVIGVEQRVQAGLINACLDLASLIVNPMFVRGRGANIQTQQIRQRIGGIVDVDGDPNKALTLLQQPAIPNEILQQIPMSQARVEMTSGANQQLTMGAQGGGGGGQKGQLSRSGTGAAGIIQATMNRIGGFAEAFVRQVYEPLLYKIHDLNRDKLPIAYIRKVLGDNLGKEATTFDPSDFLNARAEFDVLAGSHLAAKAQMAQSLFMMIQLFENAPLMDQLNKISQKKVNIEELFHMVHDISGWKNYYKIIEDMTPQEIQLQQQQSQGPAQAKLQGQMQINQQKFGMDQQIIDQENEARTARDIFRVIAEKSAEPEALLGAEQPQEGLGSQEAG